MGIATSGVPVREPLWDTSVCGHHAHGNSPSHKRAHHRGRSTEDVSVVAPLLLPTAHHPSSNRRRLDAVFLASDGRVTCVDAAGAVRWTEITEAAWRPEASSTHGGRTPEVSPGHHPHRSPAPLTPHPHRSPLTPHPHRSPLNARRSPLNLTAHALTLTAHRSQHAAHHSPLALTLILTAHRSPLTARPHPHPHRSPLTAHRSPLTTHPHPHPNIEGEPDYAKPNPNADPNPNANPNPNADPHPSPLTLTLIRKVSPTLSLAGHRSPLTLTLIRKVSPTLSALQVTAHPSPSP